MRNTLDESEMNELKMKVNAQTKILAEREKQAIKI